LDSDERGTARDDVDYGLSCLAENDCYVDLSAPGWGPTSPIGLYKERFRSRFAGGVPAGVLIDCIQPGSFFDRLGFRNGDVIRSINGLAFDRPDQALTILKPARQEVLLDRGRKERKRVWKTYRLHSQTA